MNGQTTDSLVHEPEAEPRGTILWEGDPSDWCWGPDFAPKDLEDAVDSAVHINDGWYIYRVREEIDLQGRIKPRCEPFRGRTLTRPCRKIEDAVKYALVYVQRDAEKSTVNAAKIEVLLAKQKE